MSRHIFAGPVLILSLAITASGCGAGSGNAEVAQRTPSATSAPATAPTMPAPHRRSTASPQAEPSRSAGQPPSGSYDDTSGTTARAPRTQKIVLAHLPGPTTARCVDVADHHSVRSGDLAMGDFATARATFAAVKGAYDAAPSNLYVIPTSRNVRSATITLTRVGGGAAPITIRTHQVAQAAQWHFFPFVVKLTRPGTWRFTVTSGGMHGCFLASFRA